MLPYELSNCELKSDTKYFIDGKITFFNFRPFFENKTLFIPVIELSRGLFYIVKTIKGGFTIEKRNISHEFIGTNVFDIVDSQKRKLEYKIIFIENSIFIDAKYYITEHNITIAWEEETNSLYFATVQHYERYRRIPYGCFSGHSYVEREFRDVLMFCDGTFIDNKNGFINVTTTGGTLLLLSDNKNNMISGLNYRFCFKYIKYDADKKTPIGNLIEISIIDDTRKIGNIIYNEKNWAIISAKQTGELIDNHKYGKFDSEKFFLMLNENPRILLDRKKFKGYLCDVFPINRREINLIMYAYDNDIFNEIDNVDCIDDIFFSRMVKKLVNNNGIQETLAKTAVNLCCEIYGSRIKNKKYISKEKKYAQNNTSVNVREDCWIIPKFIGTRSVGEVTFPKPENWKEKYSEKREAYYYYPYNNDNAIIYIARIKWRDKDNGQDFDYQICIKTMAKGIDNISYIEDYYFEDVLGKKANIKMKIDNRTFDTDVYLFDFNNYVYTFSFGENGTLSQNLKQFASTFIPKITFEKSKHIINDDSSLWDLFEMFNMDFSVRTVNKLKSYGIKVLGDLKNKSYLTLSRCFGSTDLLDKLLDNLEKEGINISCDKSDYKEIMDDTDIEDDYIEDDNIEDDYIEDDYIEDDYEEYVDVKENTEEKKNDKGKNEVEDAIISAIASEVLKKMDFIQPDIFIHKSIGEITYIIPEEWKFVCKQRDNVMYHYHYMYKDTRNGFFVITKENVNTIIEPSIIEEETRKYAKAVMEGMYKDCKMSDKIIKYSGRMIEGHAEINNQTMECHSYIFGINDSFYVFTIAEKNQLGRTILNFEQRLLKSIMTNDDYKMFVLKSDIDELDLSVRAYNSLRRAGINTIGELLNKTKEDMFKVRNLGRKSIEEVITKLKELGLCLKDSD